MNVNYDNNQIELAQPKAEIDEMRILRTQAEQLERDGSRNILKIRSLLEAEKEKNDALEARIDLLVANSNDVGEELARLRSTITGMSIGVLNHIR